MHTQGVSKEIQRVGRHQEILRIDKKDPRPFEEPITVVPGKEPGVILNFIACELGHIQIIIPTLLLQQLIVVACFHDTALIQYNDHVRILYGG